MNQEQKKLQRKVSQGIQKKIDLALTNAPQNDPRRELFIRLYFDPASPTFSNGYQSAIQAGFSHQYSKNIVKNAEGWLKEFRDTFREKIFNKAEVRLWELMHSGSEKVAADMTKFALSTLGKDTYSPKITEEQTTRVIHQMDEEQVQRILSRMKPKEVIINGNGN